MQNFKDCKKVIAAVIEKGDKVFIAQRAKKDALEDKWEFPGGKLEPGETHQECLKRELFEEFEIVAQIGEYVCTSDFYHKDTPMQMLTYRVPSFTGEIKLIEHKDSKWVLPEELLGFEFPDADLPIIKILMRNQKPSR